MVLLDGPPERQRVRNVALMMFCDHADRFFPYMQVEIVRFPNGSIKDPKNFVEVPPIPLSVIEKGERFKTRMYRNRRLGEFLKELDLTEGRCTGIPTIQEGLEKNGSPRAVFETDDDRKAVCVTIPIQPEYYKNSDHNVQNIVAKRQSATENDALDDALTLRIIDIIKKDPHVTQQKMVEELKVPRRTLQRKMTGLSGEVLSRYTGI